MTYSIKLENLVKGMKKYVEEDSGKIVNIICKDKRNNSFNQLIKLIEKSSIPYIITSISVYDSLIKEVAIEFGNNFKAHEHIEQTGFLEKYYYIHLDKIEII